MIGATLPEVTILPNYKYVKINLGQKNPSSDFLVNGWAENTVMWFTTKSEDILVGNEKIVNCSVVNLDYGEDTYINIDLTNADWLYFQFSNVDTATPKVELLNLTELGGTEVNKITSTLILLNDTTPSLETGLYVLDAPIYFGMANPSNLIYSVGELIYYDSASKIFYGAFNSIALENGTWLIMQNENIENTLSSSRDKIPTSQAVYNAIQNGGLFTTLNETLTFNLDGTNNLNLQEGYYLTQLVQFYDRNGLNTSGTLSYAYCYYNANDKRLALCGIQHNIYNFLTYLYFIDSEFGWVAVTHTFTNVLENNKIETNITSSSDNTKVAGAKATYDLVKANGIPEIPATTTTIDLTTLEEGLYHFNHDATINCGNNVSFLSNTGRDRFLSFRAISQYTKVFTIFDGLTTYYGSVGTSSSNYRQGGFATCEQLANKVSTINSSYTQDIQYPSAKAVYNALNTNVFRKSADPVQVTTSVAYDPYIIPLTIGQYSSPYFTANQDGTISVNSSVIKGVKVQATINVQEADSTDRELNGRIEIVYNGIVVNYAESWGWTKGGRVTFNLVNTYQANENYIIRLVIRQTANTSINHNVVAYCSVEGLV